MIAEWSVWTAVDLGHQALQEPRSRPLPPKRDYRQHHKRFDQFPGDLFPLLPRGRKAVCMLHGLEKIASWVVCGVYDYLEERQKVGEERDKAICSRLCIWLGGGVGCLISLLAYASAAVCAPEIPAPVPSAVP